jgi:hypothetical protein
LSAGVKPTRRQQTAQCDWAFEQNARMFWRFAQ